MKNVFYLFAFAVLIVSFNACNSSPADNAWQTANTNAYQDITKNPKYRELITETGPSGVYYKIIKSGTDTVLPFQTSTVKVLYKGTYYDGTIFDTGTSRNDIPMEFSLQTPSSVVSSYYTLQNISRGLSFALQNMTTGDKWEIWIPYYLGYGPIGLNFYSSSYTSQTIVQSYSTLVYEIELVSITQFP
jgi:peptidylprolyl isomerase/FKBP-type peptidyl-prolyl cis-trans isomerase FklB